MARPSRAPERRAELVAAARRAVIERGVLGLRLRDVADTAGMSSAAVLYYFPTLAALLNEVQQEAVERFCTAREEIAATEHSAPHRLLRVLDNGLPTGRDDELCLLLYELGTFARRDAGYAAQYIKLYERQLRIYTGVLESGAASGHFTLTDPPLTIAHHLVTLEDGYGLHLTQAVPTVPKSTAAAMLRAYASTATRCDLEEYR